MALIALVRVCKPEWNAPQNSPNIVKKQLLSLFLVGISGLVFGLRSASATNYAGNGNTGFNGAVGNGTLSVTNDSSGAFIFAFTLGGFQTNFGGNDLVIYVDNNNGGGIGTSTAGLTDTADGGRQATSEYSGTNRSTLSFGTLMSPQLALDLSINNANVYGILNGGTFTFTGGQTVGGTSQGGVTYAVSTGNGTSTSTVLTLTVPATDLGLTANTASTIKLFAIQISETGYSSNEATVAVTGNLGYGNTQTISAVNSFTSVPEPSTWGLLLLGVGGLVIVQRRRSLTH